MHWFDGEMSRLIVMLQPNWNMDICGVERAAVSTSWTCPELDMTTILEDMEGKNLNWYGINITWIGEIALIILKS